MDLAVARAKALLALGDAAGADAVLDRTPGVPNSAGLSQVAAEAALITDQPDKACHVGEALSAGRDGLYWLRLRAYCRARQGKTAEAQLTFTLAGQEGADADYSRLMAALMANSAPPAAGPAVLSDGVDYSLSKQLQLDLAPALAAARLAIAEHVRATTPPPPLLRLRPHRRRPLPGLTEAAARAAFRAGRTIRGGRADRTARRPDPGRLPRRRQGPDAQHRRPGPGQAPPGRARAVGRGCAGGRRPRHRPGDPRRADRRQHPGLRRADRAGHPRRQPRRRGRQAGPADPRPPGRAGAVGDGPARRGPRRRRRSSRRSPDPSVR